MKALVVLAVLGLCGCEVGDGSDGGVPGPAQAADVAGLWKISGNLRITDCIDTDYNSGNFAMDISPFRIAQQNAKPADDAGLETMGTLMASELPETVGGAFGFLNGVVEGIEVRFRITETTAAGDNIAAEFVGEVDELGDIRGDIEGAGPRPGCAFEGSFFVDIE